MTRAAVKLLAFPRDQNPYQELFYRELEKLGYQVRYAGTLTRSRALNLVLLPAELVSRRVLGWRLVHIHWVFGFAWPGTDRFAGLRRCNEVWFRLVLSLSRLVGLRLIWTAHNLLPHEPVFHDDVAARRALVRASDLVLAHSDAVLAELTALRAQPRRSAVIGLAPSHSGVDASVLRRPGEASRTRRLLFFGKIREYKGVEDLLDAMALLPGGLNLLLTVAGECADPALVSRLEQAAGHLSGRVELRLGVVPEPDVASLMEEADAVVLPFRRVTSSGSALHALSHGRPLVVPDVRAFDELPPEALFRYDGSTEGLAAALTNFASTDAAVLQRSGAAASAYAQELSWATVAKRAAAALDHLPPLRST